MELKEYFFLSMLNRGYYMASRGFVALSLDVADEHIASFVDDVASWAEQAATLASA